MPKYHERNIYKRRFDIVLFYNFIKTRVGILHHATLREKRSICQKRSNDVDRLFVFLETLKSKYMFYAYEVALTEVH